MLMAATGSFLEDHFIQAFRWASIEAGGFLLLVTIPFLVSTMKYLYHRRPSTGNIPILFVCHGLR